MSTKGPEGSSVIGGGCAIGPVITGGAGADAATAAAGAAAARGGNTGA